MKTGLGEILIVVGIAIFIGLFQRNLHSIEDPQRIRKSSVFLSNKFISACFLGLFICAICVFLQFHDEKIFFVTHAQILLYVTTLCIFVPKYYINQNENLELYFSSYHQIPAPVLPWQLPEGFNPNLVQLTFIKPKN